MFQSRKVEAKNVRIMGPWPAKYCEMPKDISCFTSGTILAYNKSMTTITQRREEADRWTGITIGAVMVLLMVLSCIA